jgi:hypothetical protein
MIERSARRLWRDDLVYAERLAELRARESTSFRPPVSANERAAR